MPVMVLLKSCSDVTYKRSLPNKGREYDSTFLKVYKAPSLTPSLQGCLERDFLKNSNWKLTIPFFFLLLSRVFMIASKRSLLKSQRTMEMIWCILSSIPIGKDGCGSKEAGTNLGRGVGSSWTTIASTILNIQRTRSRGASSHLKTFR